MSSVDTLKALISSKGGVAMNNQFMVKLPEMPFSTSRDLNILCRNVILPGRQILTSDRIVGPKATKTAYAFSHDECSMTFQVLNDYGVKKYFEHWQNMVFNQGTFEAGYKKGSNGYGKDIQIMQLKKGFTMPVFKKDIPLPPGIPSEIKNRLPKFGPIDFSQGEISFDLFKRQNVVYECTLEHAYPVTMTEIQLNNEANGLVEITISFAYDNWRSALFYNDPDTTKDVIVAGLINRVVNKFN